MAGAVAASAPDGDVEPAGGTRGDGHVEANAHGEQNQNILEGSKSTAVSPDGPTGAAEDAATSSKQAKQAENEDKTTPEVMGLGELVSGDSVAGSQAPLSAHANQAAEQGQVVVEGEMVRCT